MLEVRSINPTFDRRELLSASQFSTWVVADLEHKRWLQDIFFETESWLSEDRALRANELWSKLLVRNFPDFNFVSPMFMDSYIRQWLPKQKIEWARSESSSKVLKDYLEFFLPLLVNNESRSLMSSWFSDNPSALMRWGAWFQLSARLWDELYEQRILLPKWAPAFLLGESQELKWQDNLIIDLGPELSIVEAQLFQELSKHIDVLVLAPEKNWRDHYSRALWPYQFLLDEESENIVQPLNEFKASAHPHRYVTQLSEVRGCVSTIRKWLDSGVKPSDISVVCADPEEYWPVLNAYLEKEGIPCAKPNVSVAHSVASISRWLSQVRVRSHPLSSEDYEAGLFSKMTQPEMSYEKFRSLLSHIYSEDDLKRIGSLRDIFKSDFKPEAEITRDQFMTWAIQLWDFNSDPETLRQIMSTILLESPAYLALDLKSWSAYLQTVAGKTEIQIRELQSDGLLIRKLNSVYLGQETHQFFIGHSDAALDESLSINISLGDVSRLAQDLGFLLNRPEPGKAQMLTEWSLAGARKQSILSYSQSDFSGTALGASIAWLRLAQLREYSDKIESDFLCRWDEIQEQGFEKLETPFGDKKVMLKDLGEEAPAPSPLKLMPRLSASQLEAYMDCPFKFTAGKLFGLRAEPEIDLDMDRLRKGRLMHKCFEILTEIGVFENFSEDRLKKVIQEARFSEGIQVSSQLWPLQERSTLKMLEQFLEFERGWQKEFPKTQIVGKELAFKGKWRGLEFSGKIDRVDRNDKGQYVVLDYKSSGGSLTNYGSWIENHRIQLLIYCLALREAWTEFGAVDVVGAFYFNAKDWDRTKGFGIEDSQSELFVEEKSKRNLISSEKFESLFHKFENLLEETSQKIKEGRLWPEPEKPDQMCDRCDWRTLCRAPHLN